MSHPTVRRKTSAAEPVEPALPLDTSKLNEGQRAALEVAEAAREESVDSGFARQLFMGRFEPQLIEPFPVQTAEDRKVGDDMVAAVGELLTRDLDPEAVDATREIPPAVIEGLKDLGVFRMKVPVEYGGLGFSQVNYNRVLMAIASYCASTAVVVSAHQSIGVPQPLKMFGTDDQKNRYFPRIVAGALTAFALTEPDVGSDPARMSTTAVLSDDGSHYVLNGVKLWTTNGPTAELLVVMARTDTPEENARRARITAFIVETDTPGIEVVHRCDFMGLRAIQNGVMRFTDVRVPADNVLWGEGKGLKLALRTLNTGRLTLPAACTGLGKSCLAIARDWGNERTQWGLPIGRHEAGRTKIADIAATTFAMEAVTWLTSHWADAGRDIRIEAAMAKLFCSESAWRLVDVTMALRGGRGYERASSLRERGETPYPVERMMRDCRINTIIEGTSDIMRLFIAREALDEHLSAAMGVMRTDVPRGDRVRAGVRLAGRYARWLSARVAGRMVPHRHGDAGGLATHYRYVETTSHRLATTMFRAMAVHREKLEREQVVLGGLMDIGTELFAMSAACAYARELAEPAIVPGHPRQLADAFCRQARARVDVAFRDLKHGRLRKTNRGLAKQVLEGHFQWMEEGILETR